MRPGNTVVSFVFVVVMFEGLGFSMVVPVFPRIVSTLTGGNIALASTYLGLYLSTFALMQFVSSPILGALSDAFGRRPVLLLSCFGLSVDYVIMALAPNLQWLFIGRILSGITSCSSAIATAYIADVTEPDERASKFGLLNAAYGTGFIVGPVVGSFLGGTYPTLPFWVAASLAFASAGFGTFVFPGHFVVLRSAWQLRTLNPLTPLLILRRDRNVLTMAVACFFCFVAQEVFATVFVLYSEERFNWSLAAIGMNLAAIGMCYMLTMAFLVAPIVRQCGYKWATMAGLTLGAIGFVTTGMAQVNWLYFAAGCSTSLAGVAQPAMQAWMSKSIDARSQGQLQGTLNSLRGLAMIVGPHAFAAIFSMTIGVNRHLNGLVWFFAAGLLVVAAVVTCFGTRLAPIMEELTVAQNRPTEPV